MRTQQQPLLGQTSHEMAAPGWGLNEQGFGFLLLSGKRAYSQKSTIVEPNCGLFFVERFAVEQGGVDWFCSGNFRLATHRVALIKLCVGS